MPRARHRSQGAARSGLHPRSRDREFHALAPCAACRSSALTVFFLREVQLSRTSHSAPYAGAGHPASDSSGAPARAPSQAGDRAMPPAQVLRQLATKPPEIFIATILIVAMLHFVRPL